MTIKILGIDPSMSNWGMAHALFDKEAGTLTIEKLDLRKTESSKIKGGRKSADDMSRARILRKALIDGCVDKYVAIAEIPIGSQSSRAMASYGMCIGVLASCPIFLVEVSPLEVKMASVGSKTASKKEMIEWAYAKHPNANWNMRKSKGKMVLTNDCEHLADAIAVIYAGIKKERSLHERL